MFLQCSLFLLAGAPVGNGLDEFDEIQTWIILASIKGRSLEIPHINYRRVLVFGLNFHVVAVARPAYLAEDSVFFQALVSFLEGQLLQ